VLKEKGGGTIDEKIKEVSDEKLEELIAEAEERIKELEDAYYRETDQHDQKRKLALEEIRKESAREKEQIREGSGFYSATLLDASFRKEAARFNEIHDEWIAEMTHSQEKHLEGIRKLKRKKEILEKEKERRLQQAYEELDDDTKKRMKAEKLLKDLQYVGIDFEDPAIRKSLEEGGFSVEFLREVAEEMKSAEAGK
jgi:hypothetical protein